MNKDILNEVINNSDKRVLLSPVIKAAYSLEAPTEERLIQIAKEMNTQLECELFEDFDYEKLRLDFSIVTRAISNYIYESTKFRSENLERALKNNLEILEDVIEVYNNPDDYSSYDRALFATDINDKLGYKLFPDLYSYTLLAHLEKVAKAIELYKKEGKIIRYINE